MTEQVSDHREALTQREGTRREPVTEVLGAGRTVRKSVDYWGRREFLRVAGRRLIDTVGSVRRC